MCDEQTRAVDECACDAVVLGQGLLHVLLLLPVRAVLRLQLSLRGELTGLGHAVSQVRAAYTEIHSNNNTDITALTTARFYTVHCTR